MGTERESTSFGSCVSLLLRLHSPKPSELAHMPKGKRKSLGRGTVGPKSVSPSFDVLMSKIVDNNRAKT